MNGLLFFSKYAFAPNILQYCGPLDSKAFLDIYKDYSEGKIKPNSDITEELKHLSLQFEGAVPYLKFIASENKIKDIFDIRVVEAYWLGNDLLNKVRVSNFYHHIEDRFKKRMLFQEWQSLKDNDKALSKAKPFHSFHVFNIYSHMGLIRSGARNNVLKTMDSCRIGWGEVKDIVDDNILVEYRPLEFNNDGILKLGEKTTKNFHSFDESIKKGETVSLHWDYICDKLTPQQKQNLTLWTIYHMKIFNRL